MRRFRRYLVPLLMFLVVGSLLGSTCDFNFNGVPNVHVTGYGQGTFTPLPPIDAHDPFTGN